MTISIHVRTAATHKKTKMKLVKLSATLAIIAFAGTTVHADVFLDLTSVTPGSSGVGTFSGTLGGIAVTGSISSAPVFSFNPIGSGVGDSTIDGSSSQFSYPTIFSPTSAATDRVGFTYTALAGSTVSLTFSSPVTNPVFHIANMDWMAVTFLPTPGFSSLTLLNGNNGPDGDGVDPDFGGAAYGFALVTDKMPWTTDSTPPSSAPPVSGDRSAYGSVQINGTFSSLVFVTDAMGPFSDDGSFTISTVPEPASLAAFGLGLAAIATYTRRR